MTYLPQIVFLLCLAIAFYFFAKSAARLRRNILLGKDVDLNLNKAQSWKNMFLIALGQKKMFKKPIPAFFHLLIYVGFIIINIEILEIILDGIFGTHRMFAPAMGALYPIFISIFELLAVGVILACVVFLIRRHLMGIKRFESPDLKGWPRVDADIILGVEILLMAGFLTMNAADLQLQQAGHAGYIATGSFWVSQHISVVFAGLSESQLIFAERTGWWFHIIGVLLFLNYIPYSKHLHIFLAFPNTYYSKQEAAGKMKNMDEITQEVKMMLNPESASSEAPPAPESFGAKDVDGLNWKNILDSYSCTECGRCTAACPANITGKKLSPRKIMMDVRDRAEELGAHKQKNGKTAKDNKQLLGDYITDEELWACTTCNACVEECPVNIDPLSIILEMRRSLVMEDAKSPSQLNNMFSSIENNGIPWQFSPEDRDKWSKKES